MLDLDRTERLNLQLIAGALAASLALRPGVFAASLAVGAAIEVVNYRALRRYAALFLSGQMGGARAWTGAYALRFAFVAIAMALALGLGAHPVGLILGLSTILPAAVISAWRAPIPALPVAEPPAPDDPSWDEWNPWLARERTADADEEEDAA